MATELTREEAMKMADAALARAEEHRKKYAIEEAWERTDASPWLDVIQYAIERIEEDWPITYSHAEALVNLLGPSEQDCDREIAIGLWLRREREYREWLAGKKNGN